MNVVIAGLGDIGLHVASQLAADGHQLTVIDNDPGAIARAEESLDALTLLGPADAPAVLKEAQVESADLFAGLTGMGPVNLIAGLRAKELGAGRTIARVRERHYFDDQRGLYPGYMGLDLVVNDQLIVASELRRLVRAHGATSVNSLAHQFVEVVQLQVDEDGPGVNKPIGELSLPDGLQIAAIQRRETVLLPHSADMIQVGDEVVAAGRPASIQALERLFAPSQHRDSQRTYIVGGGGVGQALAKALLAHGSQVVIIERDAERCEVLSQQLERAQVLHGDGTDVHLLEECGAASADVFCAVSGLDEVNLMAGLLARDLGAPRCITLVHKPDYVHVCRRLGLEINVSPRRLVSRELTKRLQEGALLDAVDVLDGKGAVLELQVAESSKVAGRSVGDIAIPRGATLCALLSSGRVVNPTDDMMVNPGDRLILFTQTDVRQSVERLFKRPLLGR